MGVRLGRGSGRALGRLGALVVLGVVWALVATASASADQASFFYTGARQFFTVPDKVTSLDIIAERRGGRIGVRRSTESFKVALVSVAPARRSMGTLAVIAWRGAHD